MVVPTEAANPVSEDGGDAGSVAATRIEAFELADTAVSELTALDPCTATELGIIDPQGRLTDFSPAGIADRAAATQSILERLDSLDVSGSESAEIAGSIMQERLGNLVEMADAGDYLNDLNILASPPQSIRMALELLPADCDPAVVQGRLADVGPALAGWREALSRGVVEGIPAARRQALAVAEQLEQTASGWLPAFVEKRGDQAALLGDACGAAAFAMQDSATWLNDVYAQQARSTDAVGEEAYLRKARAWNGDDLDLAATYSWGWEELDRLRSELTETAQRVQPGLSLGDVKRYLDENPAYQIRGVDTLTEFLTSMTQDATAAMDGTLFDIPAEIKHCDVRIAAEGAAAAPYYVPPSEDLSRPGSTWYPTRGKDVFPRWWLVSVWYHEGVPGHHLQFGMAAVMREQLSRFQRVFGWTSGHAEGWALYAERLMDELGYFDDPALRFGYLSAQAMRAARVVLDIGMHLELDVPDSQDQAGQPVDAKFANRMLQEVAMLDADFAASEVDRYLGLPGQAISYKVGEREWLGLREQDRKRQGVDFDLKAWHMRALDHGPMGLGPFRSLMTADSD